MPKQKLALLLLVAVLIAAFFAFDLGQYLELQYLKQQQARIEALRDDYPLRSALLYLVVYVIVTGLSLPGAALMTLLGGAVFGLLTGTVLVSMASTAGATLAFLVARYLFRDAVQERFGDRLQTINRGVEREGAFYLFTLRLVPAFPFFVINLVMALTPVRTWTFAWVSWLGMLPGTIVYVNAGTQLAGVESTAEVLSPEIIGAFVLLGVFPLVARRVVLWLRSRRVYRDHPKPARFERDLVVIGAGSAGLVAAYVGAAVKAKVTLVERDRMGGDCLNTGCVPSKALIRTANFVHSVRHAERLGCRSATVDFDFPDVMARVKRVIERIEPHDSVERYTGLGVECVSGEARITSPYTVSVGERAITTRSIVIATGARPLVPAIPGLADLDYLTSENLWELKALPGRLLVLGGGPIGCELAQAFARLGSQVTVVEMLPRLMAKEDREVSELVQQRFVDEGVDLRLGHKAKRFEAGPPGRLVAEHAGADVRIEFDQVLVALGRKASVEGLGLDQLGIGLTPQGTLAVNEFLQTRFPNVLGCGDVVGPYQFTHVASHQAWYAAVNALFGDLRRSRVDYSVIPWATFTDPEVARVGLSEQEATECKVAHEVTRYGIDDLDRAIADEAAVGFVKVLTAPGRDRILGATIVGEHAAELIVEFIAGMRHGFGLKRILSTIHIYPTHAEANKYAAGQWQRAHVPTRLLRLVERYHGWRRGV